MYPQGSGVALAAYGSDAKPEDFVVSFRPGRRFEHVRFSTFHPNPAFPSQAHACKSLEAFVVGLVDPIREPQGLRRLFRRRSVPMGRGLYLDGGFGVGKTHLLTSAYFAAVGQGQQEAANGQVVAGRPGLLSFHELMYAVGVLGMQRAVDTCSGATLLCIDEFELDDPGNTHLVNKFLAGIMPRGCSVIATSNTPPGALGEGRFNSHRFQQQIRSIADRFETLRLDGPDYRQRGHKPAELLTAGEYKVWAAQQHTDSFAQLDAAELQDLLLTVHPAHFAQLLHGVRALGVTGLTTMTHEDPLLRENTAIRFVHFVDKVYEMGLSLGLTGVPLRQLFHESYRDRGYAKKYARCLSRLSEMMTEARETVGS